MHAHRHKKNGGINDAAVLRFAGSGTVRVVSRPDCKSYSSKRSKVITLVQAAMKSFTKSSLASPAA